MTHATRSRRSALYLPASNSRAIAKARHLPADVIILDLEDAVAPDAKDTARTAAVAAVKEGGFGEREVAVRINALDTSWGERDLAVVAEAAPDAILLPKVASAADIDRCHRLLADAPDHVGLWAMVETAAIVGRLDAVAAQAATTRLSLLVLGLNDLARETGARLAPGRTPFLPVMSLAVAAARAHGLAVLDGVCNDFHDTALLEQETEQALLFGFDGKTLIHPAQIAACNRIFAPSEDDVTWADTVIAAFAQPENVGRGAIRLDGRMVELLHLEQARRICAIADRIATQDGGSGGR